MFFFIYLPGGAHVVVTFLPEDDSENKQIFGRTCRMGNPGSGRKILFAEDLQHLVEKPHGDIITHYGSQPTCNWDDFLYKRRNERQVLMCMS